MRDSNYPPPIVSMFGRNINSTGPLARPDPGTAATTAIGVTTAAQFLYILMLLQVVSEYIQDLVFVQPRENTGDVRQPRVQAWNLDARTYHIASTAYR